jgi:hypothetical protein
VARKRRARLIGHKVGSYAQGRTDALAGRPPRHARATNPHYFQGFVDAQMELASERRLAQLELEW